MKLGLQIVLGILSLIPMLLSILGITQWAGRLLPENSITANFDERGKSASEHSNSTLYTDDKAYKADFSPRVDVRRSG